MTKQSKPASSMALTSKQEAFAQKYVEGATGADAYRHAYNAEKMSNEAIWVKASEVLHNGKVSVRIEELKEQHAKRHNITIDYLTDKLKKAMDIGEGTAAPAAIVAAVKELGVLYNLRVEQSKVEVNQKHEDRLQKTKEAVEQRRKKAAKSKNNAEC